MPTFAYSAIEGATGRECDGTIEMDSPPQASAALKARGLAPTSLVLVPSGADSAKLHLPVGIAAPGGRTTSPGAAQSSSSNPQRQSRRGLGGLGRVISAKGLAQFTRQLATLVKAGMPLLRSLEVLARQERNVRFRLALDQICEGIRSGGTFSEALMRHPKVFDRLYVNMVRAGEAGGVLETVLDRLAGFMEKAERIKGKVKSAMTYPVIVMTLAVGIVAALMVVVVPKFEQIFAGLLKGQPLPLLTRGVLAVSYFVQHNILATGAIVAATYGLFAFVRQTNRGEHILDWLRIKLPVLGELFLKAAVARFTRTFGTLLASGVPILQALVITKETSGNRQISSAIAVVHDRVKGGDSVARPLLATAIFPAMVASMIEVGEETGALPDMLTRIADTYDNEVDNAVAGLTSIIEPLMIVFLAVLVGTIVIALFLPIVSIIQHLQ